MDGGLLVPTNFTSVSDAAVETALKLAQLGNRTITFVHFIAIPDDFQINDEFENNLHGEIMVKNNKLSKYLQKAEKLKLLGVRAIQLDTNYHNLIEYVENNDIYMIVMGTHGAKGTRELLKGSHTQRVVRYSNVPVLVVKEGYNKGLFRHIAYFSKFEKKDLPGFRTVCDVATKFGMKLDLVSVIEKQSDYHSYLTKNMQLLKDEYPEIICQCNIIKSESLENAIEGYMQQRDIDILSLTTHKRIGIKKITDLSVTEHLVNRLKYPILTVHSS